MNPQDNDDPGRNVTVPPRRVVGTRPLDREAAAEVMRQQIDNIYDEAGDQHITTSPYDRTHDNVADVSAAETKPNHDWKQYHSAWQSYYQQYYERYYLAQLHRRQQSVKPPETAEPTPAEQPQIVSGGQASISQDQAVSELRSKLLNEVKTRSQKVRASRHFMPLVAALTVALVFGILQYNRLIIAQVKAYVSPGSINPQNVILDPTTSTKVGPEPRMIIPKINVDAPVVYDVPSLEENVVQSKLKNGVVHYPIPGANSMPGQTGNTVILGHSSNDVFDDGAYKFVFVQLDKMNKGDTFYLNYNGTRYTYSVTEKKVIDPTQISELVINSDKPLATLVTCTPPGTALKRLVVIAEQISPDPGSATQHTDTGESSAPGQITGNSPTLFERLFNF